MAVVESVASPAMEKVAPPAMDMVNVFPADKLKLLHRQKRSWVFYMTFLCMFIV